MPAETNESWRRRGEILATIISGASHKISYYEALNRIERAYLEKEKVYRKNKPYIFGAMYNWELCEKLENLSIAKKLKYKNEVIYIEQKYGKGKTWRRGETLAKRK